MASINVSISAQGATINVQADTTDPEVIAIADKLHLKLAAQAVASQTEPTE